MSAIRDHSSRRSLFSDARGRLLRWLLAAAFVVVGVILGTGAPVEASCAPPTITVNRTTVHAGDVVELTGFYLGSCNDTGGSSKRMKHIELRIVQGATDVLLAKVNADSEHRLAVTVSLPATLRPGPASLHFPQLPQDFAQVALTVEPGASTDPQTLTVTRGSLDQPSRILPERRPWNIVGMIALLAIAAGVVVVVRRRRQPRTGTPT